MTEMAGWDMIIGSVSTPQQAQIRHGPELILTYGMWPSQAMPRSPDASTASVLRMHLLSVNGHLRLQAHPLTLLQCQQSNTEEYVANGITLRDGAQYQAVYMSIFALTVLMTQPSATSHTRPSNVLVGGVSRAGHSIHMPLDKVSKLCPCLSITMDKHDSKDKDELLSHLD